MLDRITSRMNTFPKSIIVLFFIISFTKPEETKYIFGGLFDENSEDEPLFNLAIEKLNEDREVSFSPITQVVQGGPYESMLSTCSFLMNEAVVVFGPKNVENINIVQSICDDKDIPHLITRWLYEPIKYSTSINFYPNSKVLTLAYIDIVKAWEWKSFTMLYEDNESLLRVMELVKSAKQEGIVVTIIQLDPENSQNYRPALKTAKLSGQTKFVLDCKIEILETVLQHAQQVGIMNEDYNYFITNLDLTTIDMEPFKYCEAKITGIRILNPDNPMIKNLKFIEPTSLKTETALLIDAISMFSTAIDEISTMTNFVIEPVRCNNSKSFLFGTTLMNILRGMEYRDGLTGIIRFDNQGLRSTFDLDIIELREDEEGIHKIGVWNTTKGLSMYPILPDESDADINSLRNKTFIVITCLTDPYGMLKETAAPLYGNDRFEGFGIDLIHELSLMEGFNYTILIREDKKTGGKNAAGKWNGMLGDVIDGKADLAITDLTITSNREEGVDFTSPFMNLGISILAKKPGNAPPSFFSFADPFAIDTWTMLALAYGVVSVALFIMGRLCPDEWTNPYPCIEEPEFLINQFSLQNAGWFTIGSLMQQGTEIAPIAISTRMAAGMWWFFVLLIVASYTANLAAFLTTENPIELFTDVNSLVENMEKHNIKFGAKAGGATAAFFKDKEDQTYQVIDQHMEDHPEEMVSENKDGVAFAENSTYAFFMESTSIEYMIQRHCNLQQYGKLLDDKGYGIAMRKNSTYRKTLSMAILKLQASGELDKIKRKWWEERRGGGQCGGDSDSQEAQPLDLKNVEGVFYVTIGGMIASIICVIIEMLLHTIKLSVTAKVPFKEALKSEIRAYLNFSSNVKPAINKANSETKSVDEESSHKSPKSINNHLDPEPYGFITSLSKEELASFNNSVNQST